MIKGWPLSVHRPDGTQRPMQVIDVSYPREGEDEIGYHANPPMEPGDALKRDGVTLWICGTA